MLSSPEVLFKNYLWKYIDMSINKSEREYIKENCFYAPCIEDLFQRFDRYFESEEAKRCYMLILSSLDDFTIRRFFVYLRINVSRYDENWKETELLTDLYELDRFIGNNTKRFLILLLSIHFYF